MLHTRYRRSSRSKHAKSNRILHIDCLERKLQTRDTTCRHHGHASYMHFPLFCATLHLIAYLFGPPVETFQDPTHARIIAKPEPN